MTDVVRKAGRGDGESDLRELRLFVHRMEQPRAVGADFLARHRDDAAQHFAQLERAGERLQDAGQKAVPLLGRVARAIARIRIEIADHEIADGRVVMREVGQLEHARHRLLALGSVAQTPPGRRAAHRDEAEAVLIEQLHRLLFGPRHHRGELERTRHFRGRPGRMFPGDDENPIEHERQHACYTMSA